MAVTDMPTGAVGHASRVLELRLPRLSPLKPDLVRWNWLVLAKAKQSQAAIAMIRHSEVDRLDRLFADHGSPLPAIAAAHDPSPIYLTQGFDGSQTPQRRLHRRLLVAAGLLLLTIPLTSIAALAMQRASIIASIAQLEEEAGPKIWEQARAHREAAIISRVRPFAARPTVTQYLGKLADGLPADARLRRFSLATTGLAQVVIEGADRDELVAALTDDFAAVSVLGDPEPLDSAAAATAATAAAGAPSTVEIELRL